MTNHWGDATEST